MRRWTGLGFRLIRLPSLPNSVRYGRQLRRTFASASQEAHFPDDIHHFTAFPRLRRLEPDHLSSPSAWLSLLEPAIPARLRNDGFDPSPGRGAGDQAGAARSEPTPFKRLEIAEILVAARRSAHAGTGIDPLYELAVGQGRWRAAVWLVNLVVQDCAATFQAERKGTNIEMRRNTIWNHPASLDTMTANKFDIKRARSSSIVCVDYESSESLETDTDVNTQGSSRNRFRHEVFGSIWHTLGSLALHCADIGEMRPEVLEMIALLHHHDIMPSTIYQYEQPYMPYALHQPPTLYLLAGKILPALSDAACKAREENTIEEEAGLGGKTNWFRRQMAASPYRVRIQGLRPELWLEYIMWSCLHGGWIDAGAAVLLAVCQRQSDSDKPKWKPVYWRDRLRQLSSRNQPGPELTRGDLDKLRYIFDTKRMSAADLDRDDIESVKHVISGEVVSAYVDALLTTPPEALAAHGQQDVRSFRSLSTFRRFMEDSLHGLYHTTWNAVVVRLLQGIELESSVDPQTELRILKHAVNMISTAQRAVPSDGAKTSLPSYMSDPSALHEGILLRILRAQTKKGDVEGALQTFAALQDLNDEKAYWSIVTFFSRVGLARPEGHVITPGFFTPSAGDASAGQQPSLGQLATASEMVSLLRLLLDAKQYDVATSFVASESIAGPTIPESMYNATSLAPVLMRLATESGNHELLQRVLAANQYHEEGLPDSLLAEVLSAYFRECKWDDANTVVGHMVQRARDRLTAASQRRLGQPWDFSNLVSLIAGMIKSSKKATPNWRPVVIFNRMMLWEGYGEGRRGRRPDANTDCLLVMLASLDESFAKLVVDLKPTWAAPSRFVPFEVDTATFNTVLAAVSEGHGVAKARGLVDAFWPKQLRTAQRNYAATIAAGRRPISILEKPERCRVLIPVSGLDLPVAVYGGPEPNLDTFRIIAEPMFEEIVESGVEPGLIEQGSPDECLEDFVERVAKRAVRTREKISSNDDVGAGIGWLIEGLRDMGITSSDIVEQLRAAYQRAGGVQMNPAPKEHKRPPK